MARYDGDNTANTYTGTNDRDEIFGNGGDDSLNGLDGNDLIDGGEGADHITGGSGDDAIFGGNDLDDSSVDLLTGGDGNDSIEGGSGYAMLFGEGGNDTLKGGAQIDFLFGGMGNDLLQGSGDDDELYGDEGDDTLEGGAGADLLEGGTGTDRLQGGDGNDRYTLTDGNDTIVETEDGGNDTVELKYRPNFEYTLADTLENLRLGAEAENGQAQGNQLNNNLTGNNAANILSGLEGDDTVSGAGGNDDLRGGNGRDTLFGNIGNDILDGGAGGDRFMFEDVNFDGIDEIVNFNPSEDFIAFHVEPSSQNTGYNRAGFTPEAFITAEQFHIGSNAAAASDRIIYNSTNGNLYLDIDGTGASPQIQIATLAPGLVLTHNNFYGYTEFRPIDNPGQSGTPGDDTFVGTNGSDLYYGLGGTDTISGRDGNDMLNGGMGDDRIQGEQGEDYLVGDDGNDWLEGGPGNDVLLGGAGDDILDGGNGIDTFQGGAGNDTYYIDQIGFTPDTILFDETITGGIDEVIASFSWVIPDNSNLENLTLAIAAGAIDGTGNSFDNVIKGNKFVNILEGGAGNDIVIGNGENDVLTGGAGGDRFVFSDAIADASSPTSSDGVDQITDFSTTDDVIGIWIAAAAPSSGQTGYADAGLTINSGILADQFRMGTQAATASDRFIYDSATGRLFFDIDGTGATAPLQIATLSTKPALTRNHIFVVNDLSKLPTAPNSVPPDDPVPADPVPPLPQLSMTDATVTEGNNGVTNAVFTVQLNTAGSKPITVDYATTNGTAIAESDYTETSGTLIFAPGELTKTITVQINGDPIAESDETFTLHLRNITNAAIADGEGIGTITNDDLLLQPHQATSGSDYLVGSNSNDTIDGLAGNDRILGWDGNDSLIGGEGNDHLNGGRGNDQIRGGAGSDRIWGGTGNDTIWSGAGKDVIALERGVGRVVIKDFSDRGDKLGLTPGLRYKQLQFTQQGKNLLISANRDQLAVLIGVNQSQISRADFTPIA